MFIRYENIDVNMQVMSMLSHIKKRIPFVLVSIALFYGLPLIGDSTGSFMAILLFIIPFIMFVTSLFYGLKIGMELYFPMFVGVLFVPTIFIYFNYTAWVYTVLYALISLLGVFIGNAMNNKNA